METVRLAFDMVCPSCKQKQDSLGKIGESGEKGKELQRLAVCAYCGAINVVTKEWELRSITKQELEEIMETDPDTFIILMKASYFARIFPKPSRMN